MFTTVDKALVGLIGAALFLVNHFTSFHFGVEESTLTAIVGVVTPVLTYLIPNKIEA